MAVRRRLRARCLRWTVLFSFTVLLVYIMRNLLAFSPILNDDNSENLESLRPVTALDYFKKQSTRPVLPDMSESKKRQNLIIVAHGRSGSSFTGNIFNYHPSVFYLFEPYQTVERLHGSVAPLNRDYQEKSFKWMQGVFQCNFVSAKHANDLYHYYRRVTRNYPRDEQASIALSSPPFCRYNVSDPRWKIQDCPGAFDQKTLEEVCKKNYSMTVVKALMTRMPNNSIEQLINACDSLNDSDCKLLFLVRDPRGIMKSSQAASFYRETDKTGFAGLRMYAYQNCRQTELNLDIIRKLPPRWKKRTKILRYEDLAVDPSKLLPELLQFAGLPMDAAVSNWLYLASHKPKKESEQKKWREDSSARAQRWRSKVSPYEVNIIESYCGHLMKLLGYKALGASYEKQRNLSFSLIEKEYEALGWLN